MDASLIVGLLRSPLPGNVRELENIVTLAARATSGDASVRWPSRLLMPPPLPLALEREPEPPGAHELVEGLGKAAPPDAATVRRMLDVCEWHFGKAAAAFDMSEDQFYRLRAKYGLLRRD